MTPRLRTLTVATIATGLLAMTSPAVAAGHYCGHDMRFHWWGKSAFVYSFTDREGDHRHVVSTIRWGSGTPRYVFPECRS